MDCYVCQKEASQRCPRCGNPYCQDHGEDPASGSGQALCADCLSPVNAAPSGTLFRASLLALLVASVLALWLLIRPPGLPGGSSEVVAPEPSPPATPEPVTPPPPITATPIAETATPEPTPEPTPKPTPTPEPTPEPSPEPAGPIEYTVVEGDTWYGIAEYFGVDAETLAAFNGRTLDDVVVIGAVILIPQ